VPIGVNTQLDADTLTLTGIVVSVDGKTSQDTVTGAANEAEQLGILAQRAATGSAGILEEIFKAVGLKESWEGS